MTEKKRITVIMLIFIAMASLCLFYASHSTYIEYNDWWILGRSVNEVKERYGNFDLLWSSNGVAYFAHHGNKLFLSDHLDHYYFIEFGEDGIVHTVSLKTQPGG
ncbi:hypothetical protein LJC74_02550 [Eubacteriales bacterium OttesenSCG-928-A19]|nr:hypothetical protein [Eubacteriales bacterium OttesenSCG-928-A19]